MIEMTGARPQQTEQVKDKKPGFFETFKSIINYGNPQQSLNPFSKEPPPEPQGKPSK